MTATRVTIEKELEHLETELKGYRTDHGMLMLCLNQSTSKYTAQQLQDYSPDGKKTLREISKKISKRIKIVAEEIAEIKSQLEKTNKLPAENKKTTDALAKLNNQKTFFHNTLKLMTEYKRSRLKQDNIYNQDEFNQKFKGILENKATENTSMSDLVALFNCFEENDKHIKEYLAHKQTVEAYRKLELPLDDVHALDFLIRHEDNLIKKQKELTKLQADSAQLPEQIESPQATLNQIHVLIDYLTEKLSVARINLTEINATTTSSPLPLTTALMEHKESSPIRNRLLQEIEWDYEGQLLKDDHIRKSRKAAEKGLNQQEIAWRDAGEKIKNDFIANARREARKQKLDALLKQNLFDETLSKRVMEIGKETEATWDELGEQLKNDFIIQARQPQEEEALAARQAAIQIADDTVAELKEEDARLREQNEIADNKIRLELFNFIMRAVEEGLITLPSKQNDAISPDELIAILQNIKANAKLDAPNIVHVAFHRALKDIEITKDTFLQIIDQLKNEMLGIDESIALYIFEDRIKTTALTHKLIVADDIASYTEENPPTPKDVLTLLKIIKDSVEISTEKTPEIKAFQCALAKLDCNRFQINKASEALNAAFYTFNNTNGPADEKSNTPTTAPTVNAVTSDSSRRVSDSNPSIQDKDTDRKDTTSPAHVYLSLSDLAPKSKGLLGWFKSKKTQPPTATNVQRKSVTN